MCVSCGVPLDDRRVPAGRRRARARSSASSSRARPSSRSRTRLVGQYGDRVLATPKDAGFGLAAYLVPIALVLLALIAGAAVMLPKWRNRERARASARTTAPRLTDADSARLDEDLARYEV